MFKNIKNVFFKKIVLSHLDERRLLKLVQYNKELQNLLDIKLKCYKMHSGKIKIGDKNGLGKELNYFNNELII